MSAGSVVLNEKNQNQWLTEVEVSELTKLSVSTLRAHRFYRKGMTWVVKFVRHAMRPSELIHPVAFV